jgi:acyl-coenzyme A synthetase/AMP-(fatty) acid ligase
VSVEILERSATAILASKTHVICQDTHGSLMGAVENQVAEIGITEKDKTLIVLPICYLVAFGSQVLPFHASGATSVVLPDFEPRETLAAIHTHRPTKLFGFPKVYHELAEAAEANADDLGCLDFCFSAGEAMAVALRQRFRAAFGIEVTEGCGMTELHVYSVNPPHGAKKVGSIGRPIAGMEVGLVDEQERPVEESGVIGEIVVRGRSMTAGYWKNADLTHKKIKDGWFYTGDLARRDDDGDYWFFSRKSEVIRQRAAGLTSRGGSGALSAPSGEQGRRRRHAGRCGRPMGRRPRRPQGR